jgi:uncharacterized protein
VAGAAALVGDSLRVASTVGEALGVPRAASAAGGAVPTPVEDEARARTLYDAMRAALRRGDWGAFGAAFDSLGAVLRRVPR